MAIDLTGANYATRNDWLGISAPPLTIAAWVHVDSLVGARAVCSIGRNDSTGEFLARVTLAVTTGVVGANAASGGASQTAVSASGVATGVWSHVAGVFASTTSRTAYRDGVGGTPNTSSVSTPSLTAQQTGVGVWVESTPTNMMDGRIAHLAVWNVALDAAEIAALAARWSPRMIRPAALVAYWPFDRRGAVPGSSKLDAWRNGFSLTESASIDYADQPPLIGAW